MIKSACLIVIVYAVIAAAPLDGAAHFTIIVAPLISVLGIAGTSGNYAAIIEIGVDFRLYPTEFLDSTTNE